MAVSNHERVGKGLTLARQGLHPFLERELKAKYGDQWAFEVAEVLHNTRYGDGKGDILQDVAVLLMVMERKWNEVFRDTLGRAERTYVNELIVIRNDWAHQKAFSGDDTDRALDSMARLLTAVSAPEADEVNTIKKELRRVIFDEQTRTERRKKSGTLVDTGTSSSLKPWREVVNPHPDVASGRYQQAEFAADLWQVHIGEGTDEYRDPQEFFRRTYLTESLKRLLVGAVLRVNGKGGDPVVQLQTNFGGGKTHSMLALYHLLSGIKPADLVGIDSVMSEAGLTDIPKVNRAVLVGNKISPGNPSKKSDGTTINTLWGELAYQLGGKKAFDKIRADDERSTNPGDALREIFNEFGPCLILIDEWVAYARQLHEDDALPGGTFDTQFTFAQSLTEAAKGCNNCLLVVSLPASDTGSSPSTVVNDVEVGGQRGREALQRLQNVIGRVESSWRPASAEEGFEIVRRRLFDQMTDPSQFTSRDLIAREFYDFYRSQKQEFPAETQDADYENRIKAAYPIHPEVFDRLYNDWSTLIKFQRTRGVLRLMATVIHCLWEKGDKNPLILPANIPIDDPRVQFELTRYLPDQWLPIIEKDIDGANSTPHRIDADIPNLGKYSACRRVARTIYLGSAPLQKASNRGIEDRQIKLGCVMPGESPAIFGDALRHLASKATYLYQDGPRFWYSTQPTVTKMAEDRAEQILRDADQLDAELEKRLKADLAEKGGFAKVHVLPLAASDVSDEYDTRLVVLGRNESHAKGDSSSALTASKAILDSRGSAPRLYKNTLVFLAADLTRLQDLDEAIAKYLAWASIVADKDTLNLDGHQAKQAETQCNAARQTVSARIPETYQWLLVPLQSTPQAEVSWETFRLSGQDVLSARCMKKLRTEELIVPRLAGTRLRMELDKVPLWRGNHVSVSQLQDDFAQYLYLPKLAGPQVIIDAVQDGVSLLTWANDTFAYADSTDDAQGRYLGLRGGQQVSLGAEASGLVVNSDVAKVQLDRDAENITPDREGLPDPSPDGTDREEPPPEPYEPVKPTRYYGIVELDSARVGRDASRIAEEVISHLSGLVGADVKVSMEIEANIPDGAPDTVVRIVLENGRTLNFSSQEFENK